MSRNAQHGPALGNGISCVAGYSVRVQSETVAHTTRGIKKPTGASCDKSRAVATTIEALITKRTLTVSTRRRPARPANCALNAWCYLLWLDVAQIGVATLFLSRLWLNSNTHTVLSETIGWEKEGRLCGLLHGKTLCSRQHYAVCWWALCTLVRKGLYKY